MPVGPPYYGGKPAGVRCIQLSEDYRCLLYGLPERPLVCMKLKPSEEMCGTNREEALVYLAYLETATFPSSIPAEKSDRTNSLDE